MPDPLDPTFGSDPLDPPVLTDSCTILRRRSGDDGAGGETGLYDPTGAAVPALLVNVSGVGRFILQEHGGAQQSSTTWRAFVALGTDVKPGDRLQFGSQLFNVVETDAGMSGAFLLMCQMERIR